MELTGVGVEEPVVQVTTAMVDDTAVAKGATVDGRGARAIAPSGIGVYEVAGLAREWLDLISAGDAGAPGIDLSAVKELDGAGLQLLIAARRAGAGLHAPSPAVRALAERLGLDYLTETAKEVA